MLELKKIINTMGINSSELKLRKEYLSFDATTIQDLLTIHGRMGELSEDFIGEFYGLLLSFKQTQDLLPNEGVVDRLRQAQQEYFRQLTSGHYDQDYLINRLRIGLVHQKVGLEPKWYLGAFCRYLNGVISNIIALYANETDKAVSIIHSLMKVVFLDMSLALDAYFFAHIEEKLNIKRYAEQVMSNMPLGLVAFDQDFNIFVVNEEFQKIFHQSEEELKGKKLDSILPLDSLQQKVAEVRTEGKRFSNLRISIKDCNEERFFVVCLSKSSLESHALVVLMLQDVSEEIRLANAVQLSELKMDAVMDSLLDGAIIFNDEGSILSFNPAAEKIFGCNRIDMIGIPIESLLPGLLAGPEKKTDTVSAPTEEKYLMGHNKVSSIHASGMPLSLEVTLSTIPHNSHRLLSLMVRDISDQLQLFEKMELLSRAVEQTADSVIITDSFGAITFVNQAFGQTTGYSREEAIGNTPNLLKSGKHNQEFYNNLWTAIQSGKPFSEVFINKRKDGTLYYEEKTITPILDESGTIKQYVSTGKDITERMQVQERFHYLAYHDALTELPNRLLLTERLKQSLTRARWHKRKIAIMFLDLDRFKNVNDTLGHEAGDQILKEVALRLLKAVRDGDTISRLGGDEFGIMLDDLAGLDDVVPIAETLLSKFNTPFNYQGQEIFLTGSIGVSCFPNDGLDQSTLLKNADIAMYKAKELGRNTYQFYSSELSSHAQEWLTLDSSLRGAIDHEEFVLFYQPQYDIKQEKIVAVEALIRWQHPELGMVSPLKFIPMLEETGLIIPVGEWVINTAAKQCAQWIKKGSAISRVSINISSGQFSDPELVNILRKALRDNNLEAGNLEIEITESVLMNNSVQSISYLNEIRDAGLRIAIDDFGTGYSSLEYLKKFPIDILKIDRSFIIDVVNDSDSSAITSAIISLAHELGLEVVAEGVETEEQLNYLKERGCNYIQGFYFSEPVPVSQLNTFN